MNEWGDVITSGSQWHTTGDRSQGPDSIEWIYCTKIHFVSYNRTLKIKVQICFTLHNVQFVKYIFPRNRTTSNLSQIFKNTILLNIYLSQLVRVRGKNTFLSFSDFQTLDL